MPSSRLFSVIRPIKDLPPRNIRVFSITADPTVIEFITTHKELAFDIALINDSGGTVTLFINEETTGIPISNNDVFSLSDVQVGRIRITGATSGTTVIANVLGIDLLQRLNREERAPAVEVG